MEVRKGRQTPTTSVICPYQNTKGYEAIDLYNRTSRKAREWQEILIYDILAVNDEGLWTHAKFGYEIPRRNGKGEIIAIRELYALVNGERVLHTAHRTTTSHAAWERLCELAEGAGLKIKTTKQFGLETIKCEETHGYVNFRTRSSKGGLGEGYDLLIIDEAQEYTSDQESALQYVVTDSENGQTLLCGTPPTAVSSGTVFMDLRDAVLSGNSHDTGWAEWSVEFQTDPYDMDALYETNPSLGCGLTERAVMQENRSDVIDFNIQRFGLWLKYNQKSAITETEWSDLKCKELPKFTGKLFAGIKFGHNGENVALSIAVKTKDGKIFIESIDCRPTRAGNQWILEFLRTANIASVVIDGANGQTLLSDSIKDNRIKTKTILPKVGQIIDACAKFEAGIYAKSICHMGQKSLSSVASNCEKRAIGANGGFGYRAIVDGYEIALLDSVIIAHWACATTKEKNKQSFSY